MHPSAPLRSATACATSTPCGHLYALYPRTPLHALTNNCTLLCNVIGWQFLLPIQLVKVPHYSNSECTLQSPFGPLHPWCPPVSLVLPAPSYMPLHPPNIFVLLMDPLTPLAQSCALLVAPWNSLQSYLLILSMVNVTGYGPPPQPIRLQQSHLVPYKNPDFSLPPLGSSRNDQITDSEWTSSLRKDEIADSEETSNLSKSPGSMVLQRTSVNQLLPVALIQASIRFDVSLCVSYCPNEKESLVIWPGINVL